MESATAARGNAQVMRSNRCLGFWVENVFELFTGAVPSKSGCVLQVCVVKHWES